MTPTTLCRVYPHLVADGPANMARDEALLDLVGDDPGAFAFRTYAWTEPTLSLGYFQEIAEAEADPRWRGVAIVRRSTGGGAILHDVEVTYALVVARGHPLARHSAELYQRVHSAISELLAPHGAPAQRRGEGAPAPRAPRPFLCFNDRDPDDLVIGMHKVVGSAQRRRSGAVLQHGSVLLSRSPYTPELAGVGDLAETDADVTRWADRLARAVPESLGLRAENADWDARLEDRARAIEQAVYRNPGWTRRR